MNIVESMKNTLGISCVEVYLLALMEKLGIDERSLYVSGFIEPQTVIEGFLREHCNFTTYTGMERLQRIAVRQGIARLRYYVGDESPQYVPRGAAGMSSDGSFTALLKGVRPDYRHSKLMPWRDDHYVLRYEENIYDCYPPSQIEEMEAVYYDGRNIRIVFSSGGAHTGDPEALARYERELKIAVKRCARKKIEFDAGQNLPYLRDALLIVKTSRRRLNRILRSDIVDEEIAELGRLIALLEICRLRGKTTDAEDNVRRINALEQEWRERIQHG